MMKSQLRIALPAAATTAGILLAGCGSSGTAQPTSSSPSTSSAPAAASSAPAAASSAPAATASAPASPTATGPAAAAYPECSAAVLKITPTDNKQINNGALTGMSHADGVVMFTNAGSATCRMAGYPGVAALGPAGHQIRQAARIRDQEPIVVLKPGQEASALVSANTASCAKVTRVAALLVTAPNQRSSTRIGPHGALCLNSLHVGTVKPGNAAGLKLG